MVFTISVLCVDDEKPLLEIFQQYLEQTNEFMVTTASSATDALHLLENHQYDAIVSDYQMPGMDGIAFLKQVRATDKHIPFIIFTGKGWEAIAIEAFENGANFYLQKGAGDGTVASVYANLMQKIKMAIEYRRVEQALVDSEQQYRSLFETAQEAILILNGETGEVIDANKFILDMLGYPREYLIGKHLWEVGFIKDKIIAQNAFMDLKTKGYIRYENLPLETKDGRSRDVDFIGNLYTVGDKKIIQCIIQDITDRKATEIIIRNYGENLEREVTERTSDLVDVNKKLLKEIAIRIESEKKLSKLADRREVLVREVHHRVKNNLQIIISLLNLQSRNITDDTTCSMLRESQSRVKVMALVHEKLYQSDDISKIDLDDYLKFIGDNLVNIMDMKGKGITISRDIHDLFVEIDTAVPIGLIINELILNSHKYAFPNGRTGAISIAIQRQDHTLTILFKDNGVGIPEDFNWREAESLGLRLVIMLVEQLDGTIELDRSSGTAFTIVVKENN